jgi:hypothetical protein
MLVARHILLIKFQVCQNFHDTQKMQIVSEEQQDAFG